MLLPLNQTLTSTLNAGQNSMSIPTRLTNSEELDLERFKLSRTSQPISVLSTGLVVDELINGMQKLGVKADKMPNNADLLLMYKSIMEEYPNIKVGELSLAFDLAAKGKLDIDAETYQRSSHRVQVIEGKLVHIAPKKTVTKLVPGTVGTPCAVSNISIVVDPQQPHTKWSLKSHESD